MRLRYGVNEADQWWDFALGPDREQIRDRLREIDTRIIRIFVFDKGGPDPVVDWPTFVSYVQAVLNVGATPMITFAKFRRPFDDPRAVRWFAEQCSDIVWGCIERWGGQEVRDWYWCVWNEPNSDWIGGDLSFEQYRSIYEQVARGVLRWLGPYLDGHKPLIGGPAIEGFRPFWMDWAWRFVNEIDNSLIGFLDWHHYGDWREHGESGAPLDGATHRALILSQASEFEARARAIAGLLKGRQILNVCGELNTHSHYTEPVRARFNQSVFGATFYTSALLHLMRGGADVEMFWTGTDDTGGYGMILKDALPTPVFHAKKLCAQYVRYGDWISFPSRGLLGGALHAVVGRSDNGRRSAVLVHLRDESATYRLSDLDGGLKDCGLLLKIDGATGNEVEEASCDGTLAFAGYGVAVVTNMLLREHRDRSPASHTLDAGWHPGFSEPERIQVELSRLAYTAAPIGRISR